MGRLLRIVARWFFVLVVLVALVYVVEDVVLRYRLAHGGSAKVFENLTVYEAGAVKGNKLEYYFDQPLTQTCVHALFPHLGDPPCWYARKHSIKILSWLSPPGRPASDRACYAGRSSKLDVIWMADRRVRYTGHFIANTPWIRSMVSRLSFPATITNPTWILRITSTPPSASISPSTVHEARPSSGEIPRAASAPANVPSIQPPVAATT